MPNEPLKVASALRDAINAHDLDAMEACFAPDFHSELPTFPDASFTGRENVRRNWGRTFDAIPDISAEIVSSTVDGDTVWVEWEQSGKVTNGNTHHFRGVIVMDVADGHIASNRFYMHPVSSGLPNPLG